MCERDCTAYDRGYAQAEEDAAENNIDEIRELWRAAEAIYPHISEHAPRELVRAFELALGKLDPS